MTHRIKVNMLTLCVASSLLTACVSDSKHNNTSNTTSTSMAYAQSANSAYSGSRSPALLTIANASAFTMSLFDNEDFSDALNNEPDSKSRPNTIKQQRPTSTEGCQFGGTFSTTAGATVTTFNFTACQRAFASQFDGDMTLSVDAYDSRNNPINYSLGTDNLLRTEGSIKKSLIGSVRFLESANTITSTANLYRSDSRTSIQYLLKDFKLVDSQTDTVTGRIYRSNNGYIVLSSSVDLVTNTYGAPSQGYIYLNGAEGSTIKLSRPSDPTLRSYVSMELDADGDNIYEQQALVNVTIGSFESIK